MTNIKYKFSFYGYRLIINIDVYLFSFIQSRNAETRVKTLKNKKRKKHRLNVHKKINIHSYKKILNNKLGVSNKLNSTFLKVRNKSI